MTTDQSSFASISQTHTAIVPKRIKTSQRNTVVVKISKAIVDFDHPDNNSTNADDVQIIAKVFGSNLVE